SKIDAVISALRGRERIKARQKDKKDRQDRKKRRNAGGAYDISGNRKERMPLISITSHTYIFHQILPRSGACCTGIPVQRSSTSRVSAVRLPESRRLPLQWRCRGGRSAVRFPPG